jgi:hypothetical protein
MRLFTSHTLGCIVRKLQVERKCKLSRRGVKLNFAIINRKVHWNMENLSGVAETVWEAADQIERLRR